MPLPCCKTGKYRQFHNGGGLEARLHFVTSISRGRGLIKCGSVAIPFDNTTEKGYDLYNLFNMSIHEKIAKQA